MTNWKSIEQAWNAGIIAPKSKKPYWLDDDFINKYASDDFDEEEVVDEETQLAEFYNPLYKKAKSIMKGKLEPEEFYCWMQELL